MNFQTIVFGSALFGLAACGGGGGGGSTLPGPTPAGSQTLASLSAGEFSSSRNSGGFGKSLRFRDPNATSGTGGITGRVDADNRKLQGILFTDASETGLINAVLNDNFTATDVQLVNDVWVRTDFPNGGDLQLKALDLYAPADARHFDSVLGGLWQYIPDNPGGINVQTFIGGWHAGSITESADIDRTGTVTFTGNVLGYYVRNDDQTTGTLPIVRSEVTGDAKLTINFVTDQIVEGIDSGMTNLVLTDIGGSINPMEFINVIAVNPGDPATTFADSTFDAQIMPAAQAGVATDFSDRSTSDLSGRFYGPGGANQQIGITFRVREVDEAELFSGVALLRIP